VDAVWGGGRGAAAVTWGRAAAGFGHQHHLPYPGLDRGGAVRGGLCGHWTPFHSALRREAHLRLVQQYKRLRIRYERPADLHLRSRSCNWAAHW